MSDPYDTSSLVRKIRWVVGGFFLLVLLLVGSPIAIIPAGHVGVVDFFGSVRTEPIGPGVHVVAPFSRVIEFSIRTVELMETADVPSKEGLNMSLEASLLYRLDPAMAPALYRTVGRDFETVVVEPQIRAALREITASYEAKALYSTQREQIANEILALFQKMVKERGIVADAVLLRKIGLPDVVANAIQEKLRREQEAEQMKFVLQKEEQEAERKRMEAQGIADFQRIVASGISEELLEWKGIEATEKLANSPNAKIVVIGSGDKGLPLILGGQ